VKIIKPNLKFMRKFFATTALALACTGAAFSQSSELEGRVSDLEKKFLH